MSKENKIIKKPHSSENMSAEQLAELIKCADPDTGYKYFMKNHFYIQHPTQAKLLYAPFEFQDRLIDVFHQYKYSVNLLPRQVGKCQVYNSVINIRNNHTNLEYELPIGVYHEYIKAKQNGTELPDISEYQIKKV